MCVVQVCVGGRQCVVSSLACGCLKYVVGGCFFGVCVGGGAAQQDSRYVRAADHTQSAQNVGNQTAFDQLISEEEENRKAETAAAANTCYSTSSNVI